MGYKSDLSIGDAAVIGSLIFPIAAFLGSFLFDLPIVMWAFADAAAELPLPWRWLATYYQWTFQTPLEWLWESPGSVFATLWGLDLTPWPNLDRVISILLCFVWLIVFFLIVMVVNTPLFIIGLVPLMWQDSALLPAGREEPGCFAAWLRGAGIVFGIPAMLAMTYWCIGWLFASA